MLFWEHYLLSRLHVYCFNSYTSRFVRIRNILVKLDPVFYCLRSMIFLVNSWMKLSALFTSFLNEICNLTFSEAVKIMRSQNPSFVSTCLLRTLQLLLRQFVMLLPANSVAIMPSHRLNYQLLFCCPLS